jgi:quercetin dioxygenase-like cupin family protein
MKEGDIAVVAANVEHAAEVGDEPAFAVDAWNPIREDYVLDKRGE